MNLMREKDLSTAILTVRSDLTIVHVACLEQNFLGYSPRELEGRRLTDDGILVSDYIPSLIRDLSESSKKNCLLTNTYQFLTKDGDGKDIILMCASVELKGGIEGFILVCTDGRASCEQELALKRELIQADKMISLGVLVSGIAHEINNPNNFIMLNAPILKDVWEDALPILDKHYAQNGDFIIAGLYYSEVREEISNLLRGIEEGSRRIQQIVNDLREYARLEEGDTYTDVDVNKVVTKAISLLRNMIQKSTNRFDIALAHDMPRIRGNPQRLEQVIINLVQNACQALVRRNQSVQVRTIYDRDNRRVIVEVSDEGEGIDPEILDKIMTPFFTTKKSGEGTGLGLAVSRNIVERHGGEIEVESEKGRGSVFRLILPEEQNQKKPRILIADDDEGFRRSMKEALESQGEYEVELVSNGVEACIRIGESSPDLLVLDMMMPGMDGVEVCEVIKRRKDLRRLKVLIVTGLKDSPKVERVKEMGFSRVLIKPFKLNIFLEEIKALLKELS